MKAFIFRYPSLVRLRYAPLFLRIWLWFRPAIRVKLRNQRNYYRQFIQKIKARKPQILDIGANEGFVSQVFLDDGIDVFAIEPDPRNTRILNTRFGSNLHFKLYPCICGKESGPQQLFLQENGTAFSTSNPKWKNLIQSGDYRLRANFSSKTETVQGITIDEMINTHGIFAFIKIDVEGGEESCLAGLSKKVPLIIFEANLPEFFVETNACINKLHAIDPGVVFNYAASFAIQMETFLLWEGFSAILPFIKDSNIDVICRMSNYNEFYEA